MQNEYSRVDYTMQLGIGKIKFKRTAPPQIHIDLHVLKCAIWSPPPLIMTGVARVCFGTMAVLIAT
jgi:hypothetical protein